MLIDAMKRHLAEFPAEDEELIFRGPLVPVASQQLSSIGSLVTERCAGVFRPDATSTIYATLATTWQRQAAPAPAS